MKKMQQTRRNQLTKKVVVRVALITPSIVVIIHLSRAHRNIPKTKIQRPTKYKQEKVYNRTKVLKEKVRDWQCRVGSAI